MSGQEQKTKVKEPFSEKASPKTLTLLDCFCGMGGVSDGFALEGFDVTGIDIVDAQVKLGYKHKFIQADMLTLNGEDFRGYDVVWGSPPCRDFSRIATTDRKFWKGQWVEWKNPANPEKGMILVDTFLNFVRSAKPNMWIMENVPGLVKYFCRPTQISKISPTMKRAFWGNFPPFLMPCQTNIPLKSKIRDPWLRSKIPLACSQAFAQACKEKLMEEIPFDGSIKLSTFYTKKCFGKNNCWENIRQKCPYLVECKQKQFSESKKVEVDV